MQRIPTSRWLTAWWPAGDLLTGRLLTMQGQLRPPVFAIVRRHPEVRREPTSRHSTLSGRGDGLGEHRESVQGHGACYRPYGLTFADVCNTLSLRETADGSFAVQRGRNGGQQCRESSKVT